MSVTELRFSEKSKTFQIASKIFTDDLESAVEEIYGKNLKLFTDNENPQADSLLFDYIQTHFLLKNKDKKLGLHWVGKEQQSDACWIYFETEKLRNLKNIEFTNRFLITQFPQQQNICNFFIQEKSLSYIADMKDYTFSVEL